MIALALAAAQPGGTTPPHDALSYGMGGTMSGFVNLSIDLTTGAFVLDERSPFADQPPKPARRGTLTAARLAALRTEARAAVRAGFETRTCRVAYRRGVIPMPNIDAMPRMAVTLAGRTADAPVDISCWTAAANRLSDAALTAARTG